MKANRHPNLVKWFLIGFGIRLTLAVVVTLMMLRDWEAGMVFLGDLPTMLFLFWAESFLPASLSHALALYIPMSLIGGLLWGGIFMLIPLVYKAVAWLMPPRRAVMNNSQLDSPPRQGTAV
jgi:hypothetical protein